MRARQTVERSGAAGLALLLALSATGCVPSQTKSDAVTHPLEGRIWDAKSGRLVTRADVLREVASAQFVLLGEVHDNPAHHRLQREVLQALVAAGRRPALAMEQFDREHQSSIDAALGAPGATPDTVATAGDLDRKGWDWPLYAPLLETALQARLRVVALNLSRIDARNVARQGFASLGPTAIIDLALDRSWNPARQKVAEREIDDGHCGKLPASALPRMVDMQRARDATMADTLVRGAPDGAVVVAGAGHVRNDVGIPVYLANRLPGRRVVSIGFVEVDSERKSVSDYARTPDSKMPYDYAWFTSATAREDPCAGFAMPSRP